MSGTDGIRGVYLLKVDQENTSGDRTPLVGEVPVLVTETNDIGLTSPKCSPMPVGPAGNEKIKVVFRDREIESDGSLSNYDNFYLANLDGSGAPVLLLDGLERGELAQ